MVVIEVSKLKLESLTHEYKGTHLPGRIGESCFTDPDDYKKQTPELYPLGELHYAGGNGGRGRGERWLNKDETVFVEIDGHGDITWIGEVY